MTVVFTGTSLKPVFGGLNMATPVVKSNTYIIGNVVSNTTISLSYANNYANGNYTPITLSVNSGSMILMAETDGIAVNTSYYVTNIANSNVTISTSADSNVSNAVSLTTATGVLSAETSSYYVTDISIDKYITLNDVTFLNVGDKIYFTGTAVGGATITANTASPSLYTVASVDTVVNKITVVEDTNFTGLPDMPNAGTRMTVWRKDTPVSTSYATGDIVKVNYRLPTITISDNAYVELLSNNTINLHTTSIGASTSSTTDILVIPYNARGTIGKPQSIVVLKEYINYPVSTVLPMLFEQSLATTNFGLINNRE